MKPFSMLTHQQAAGVRYVLCDIDDTITTEGKLGAAAYTALWRLHDCGIGVIPVTGRPAGWCDMIVREWPVRAVVGENGAFVYYFEDGRLRRFLHPSADDSASERLGAVRDACLAGIPGCRVSHDQFSRVFDVAIDFNEDVHLGLDAARQIKSVCEGMGATAKISSIHVNAWFGDYSKVDTARLFLKNVLGENDASMKVGTLFFGDSPNDEPMFGFFPLCCAVANISPFLDRLQCKPAYVTEKECGEGFAEAVERLLSLRQA